MGLVGGRIDGLINRSHDQISKMFPLLGILLGGGGAFPKRQPGFYIHELSLKR